MNHFETNLLEAGPNRKVWPIIGDMPILHGDYGAPVELGIHVVINEVGKVELFEADSGKPLLRTNEVNELKNSLLKETRA